MVRSTLSREFIISYGLGSPRGDPLIHFERSAVAAALTRVGEDLARFRSRPAAHRRMTYYALLFSRLARLYLGEKAHCEKIAIGFLDRPNTAAGLPPRCAPTRLGRGEGVAAAGESSAAYSYVACAVPYLASNK